MIRAGARHCRALWCDCVLGVTAETRDWRAYGSRSAKVFGVRTRNERISVAVAGGYFGWVVVLGGRDDDATQPAIWSIPMGWRHARRCCGIAASGVAGCELFTGTPRGESGPDAGIAGGVNLHLRGSHFSQPRGVHPGRKNSSLYGSAGFAGAGAAGTADGDCDGRPGTGTGFGTLFCAGGFCEAGCC